MARGIAPVIETLALFAIVYALGEAASIVAIGIPAFALTLPVQARPWTLVTSVYAHASADHLVANAIALAVVGPLVARRTSRARFHAFFLATGIAAGVATLLVGAAVGGAEAVVGASGAILALAGYLLAGNVATRTLLGRITLSRRAWVVVVVALAVAVAIVTGGPRVALAAHVVGFLLGLGAGRRRLLRTR